MRILSALAPDSLFEVGLGVPNAFAKEFGKFRSVFGFLKCVTLEGFSDFGVTFAVGLAGHGEVHTYFAAFAVEVCGEVGYHFVVATFCHADFVFGDKFECVAFVKFFEFACRCAAKGTFFRCVFAFMYVAAYCADEFLLHDG